MCEVSLMGFEVKLMYAFELGQKLRVFVLFLEGIYAEFVWLQLHNAFLPTIVAAVLLEMLFTIFVVCWLCLIGLFYATVHLKTKV